MTIGAANSKSADSNRPEVKVREALRDGVRTLESASTPSGALSAELLLMHVLGCDRAWLYANSDARLSSAQIENYAALLASRAAGTPTQYLTGKQEFWGLEFGVTRDVFIPRPETEHVIEVALARIGTESASSELRIADIGTGSGCIAIAMACELTRAHVYATDISHAALEVARNNATRHGVANRVQFCECDLLSGIAVPDQFDVIISNPPYISERDAESLPQDVREHEPHIALFAGELGLDVYAPLIQEAEARLRSGGSLVLEIGFGMFEAVSNLLDSARGWTKVSASLDLAGIPRVLAATKS